ncbi:MAG: tyrosine--tRNA ligase [Candidatus Omnitrophota bacterium]|nr:tyrosine--tRNA ligase [Candidatus Omnitrophota bacterium]
MEQKIKKQISRIKCGSVEMISEKEIFEKLQQSGKNNKPLRVKYGADPSCPDLHLGHTVALAKLKQIQDLGHKVVFIIGDFTAMIGDPSGESKTRKQLSKDEVRENARTYQRQVFRVLDREKTEVVYNSSWCEQMNFREVINLASRYTVARMLERDDFLKRYKNRQPISIHEFLYPLIQGYDSVMVRADIEVGGTDQKFNLLVGRELQRDFGQVPQAVIILPLLVGLDGVKKMSKSLGNYIGLTDLPQDMFGKIMSISDELASDYYRILLGKQIDIAGLNNPKLAKLDLAAKIVERNYDSAKALLAREQFERVFSRKGLPEKIEEYALESSCPVWIIELLKVTGCASSRSQAERLVRQGAVTIDNKRIEDVGEKIKVKGSSILKVGKRKFRKIIAKKT